MTRDRTHRKNILILAWLFWSALLASYCAVGKPATVSQDGSNYYLNSTELKIGISKQTGLPVLLESLKPVPLSILPAGVAGFKVYIVNLSDKGEPALVSSATDFHDITELNVDRERGVGVQCRLAFPEGGFDKVADVTAKYLIFPEYLNVKISFLYKTTTLDRYEIGIRQTCDPGAWVRQIYPHCFSQASKDMAVPPNLPGFVSAPINWNDEMVWQYGDSIEDNDMNDFRYLGEPYGVLESRDRFFLWGCLDLGTYVCLTPNTKSGYIPSFRAMPKVTRGKTYSFDFIYKVLPKPETYTGVVRWYNENCFSSDPLSKELVRLRKDNSGPVRVPEGRVGADIIWSTDFIFTEHGREDPEKNLAEKMKDWRAKAIRVLVYERQFLDTALEVRGRPVPRNWFDTYKDGHLFFYLNWTRYGTSEPISLVRGDFCNDQFREWFVDKVKQAIETYDFDGIFWDMGWHDVVRPYSSSRPESGNHHGILRMMYDVHAWLKKNHPDKLIMANTQLGNPGNLYVDLAMLECETHPKLDFEAVKAFGKPIICLDYMREGSEKSMYYHMRGLGYGAQFAMGNNQPDASPVPIRDFMRKTVSTYPVWERQALTIEPGNEEVSGSIWASGERAMAAVFNDSDKPVTLKIKIDKRIIKDYGYLKDEKFRITVVNAQGKRESDAQFEGLPPEKTFYVFSGLLGSKGLVLLEGGK